LRVILAPFGSSRKSIGHRWYDSPVQKMPPRQSSYWCFTVNNPSFSDLISFSGDGDEWQDQLDYIFAALEVGEEGTKHYQGYLELKRHKPLAWLKKCLPRAHLEPRRGTSRQALEYCLKTLDADAQATIATSTSDNLLEAIMNYEDSEDLPKYIIWHTNDKSSASLLANVPKPKTRKETLAEMKVMIEQGKPDKELADHDFSVYVSCFRGLDKYRLLVSKPRDWRTEVIVVQGPTGTGKSRYARDKFPDAYWKQRSNWWDGYSDQDAVVVDEFYGWLPFDLLLRLCDRYPLLVETKGGQVNFVARTIVFTTNQVPGLWYKNAYFDSFIRRVTKWIVMPHLGQALEYDNYLDASHNFVNPGIFR